MDLPALIQQCTPPHVAHQTMQAVMRIESSFNPYAIGYKIVRKSDRQVFQLDARPRTREQAIGWAKWLERNGFVFDAGAAQVNSSNFRKYGLTVENAFDACQSIRVGSLILADCYKRALPRNKGQQEALRAALSCYNSGNFSTGFRTGYVQKVVTAALPKGADY
jgi:type IV secretion system protein VirB1